MKTIVVEGKTEYIVLQALFPQLATNGITIRVAYGFSNVFSLSQALIDYGMETLIILDTDSNILGHDNRVVLQRIDSSVFIGREMNIVWMDPCIELVLHKVIPEIRHLRKSDNREIRTIISQNRETILDLEEFKKIEEFINNV